MKRKGFTLIEMLITLLLLVIISLFGAVSLSFLKYKQEGQLIVAEVRSAIQYARIQASTRGHSVYLVPVDPTMDWSKGMRLIQFQNNKTCLLYQWEWNHPLWKITWTGVPSLNKIVLSNNPMSAISNGRFIIYNTHTKKRLEIVLNRIGRIKVSDWIRA